MPIIIDLTKNADINPVHMGVVIIVDARLRPDHAALRALPADGVEVHRRAASRKAMFASLPIYVVFFGAIALHASSFPRSCCGCRSTCCRNRSAASRIRAARAISALRRLLETGDASRVRHARPCTGHPRPLQARTEPARSPRRTGFRTRKPQCMRWRGATGPELPSDGRLRCTIAISPSGRMFRPQAQGRAA